MQAELNRSDQTNQIKFVLQEETLPQVNMQMHKSV